MIVAATGEAATHRNKYRGSGHRREQLRDCGQRRQLPVCDREIELSTLVDHDGSHSRRLGRPQPIGRVLKDETGSRGAFEPARGFEKHVGSRLAANHIIYADDHGEPTRQPNRLQRCLEVASLPARSNGFRESLAIADS